MKQQLREYHFQATVSSVDGNTATCVVETQRLLFVSKFGDLSKRVNINYRLWRVVIKSRCSFKQIE